MSKNNSTWLLGAVLMLPSARPTIEISGYRMVESKHQKKSMELVAAKAALYKTENIAALFDLRAWVWGQNEEPFEATGSVGILSSNSKDFEIQKEAKLLSPDGYLFQTTLLNYDASKNLFWGPDAVEAEQVASKGPSPLKMTGLGFSVDLDKSQYEIQKNVRAQQSLPKGAGLDVRSQRALMLGQEKVAFFLKKVIVKSPDFELFGERLKVEFEKKGDAQSPKSFTLDSPNEQGKRSKKIKANLKKINLSALGLVVSFSPEGDMDKTEALGEVDATSSEGVKMRADKLESRVLADGQNQVIMRGNVTIVADKRTATCEEAEYIPETGQIVLKTVASVKKDKQVLEGDLIRFSTKNSEIFVEKARGKIERKDTGLWEPFFLINGCLTRDHTYFV